MKAKVDPDACIGCAVCVMQCPERALSLKSRLEPVAVVDRERCTGCGVCLELCPVEAITVPGMSLDRPPQPRLGW